MIDYEKLDLTKYQTPCYLIDSEGFVQNLARISQAFSAKWPGEVRLGYSIKTNNTREMISLAHANGMMAEAVSGDEYADALECGYKDANIIFNGPQKTEEQLIRALKEGAIVNIDGLREVDIIESAISELSVNSIHVGLRVNFDLENVCPGETTAGDEVSRFGLCVENGDFEAAVERLHSLGIKIRGLHMHYSSKSRSKTIFSALAKCAAELATKYQIVNEINFIDIGGGLFMGQTDVPGKPSMDDYADAICEKLKTAFEPEKVRLILEPGASLVATCVYYLTKVIDVKNVRGDTVITMDGSTLDINPFMAHREPVHSWVRRCSDATEKIKKQIVCGSTCMELDRFFKMQGESGVAIGDMLSCECAGAYTMSFTNRFINNPPRIYRV